eukprot:EG_transcript_65183
MLQPFQMQHYLDMVNSGKATLYMEVTLPLPVTLLNLQKDALQFTIGLPAYGNVSFTSVVVGGIYWTYAAKWDPPGRLNCSAGLRNAHTPQLSSLHELQPGLFEVMTG